MKNNLLIIAIGTLLCSCHTVYQQLHTESWSLGAPESSKTYFLITDPTSSSFFKNNIEKQEMESYVVKILDKKGYSRVKDSVSASTLIVATFWSAHPEDTIVQVQPVNVIVGSTPYTITTQQENTINQNNSGTSTRNNSQNNISNSETQISYRNVYAFSGRYDTITEIKRKIDYTFILSAYDKSSFKDSTALENQPLLWKSQVWLPKKTDYTTVYSSSQYSQNDYMAQFAHLIFGFGRRKKYEFRSTLPLMIAASYDLIENSRHQEKIYLHNKFEGYQVIYGKNK